MIVAVVATASSIAATRETVRAALAVLPDSRCEVLDLDGGYSPHGSERVSTVQEAELDIGAIGLTHDDESLTSALTALWSAHLLDGEPVLGLAPGVILLSRPMWGSDPRVTIAVARAIEPNPEDATGASLLANELFVLGKGARPHLAPLRELATSWRTAPRWLDLLIARVPREIVIDDAVLVSSHNSGPDTVLDLDDGGFARDGARVTALDLGGLDPERDWLFDSRPGWSSGPPMTTNPALAALVGDVAARERSVRAPRQPRRDRALIREIARGAEAAGESLDPALADLDAWLLQVVPSGDRSPVARYLAGIRDGRVDLIHAYPRVPGPDATGLAHWALDHGVHESAYDTDLLRRAADVTLAAQPPGDGGGRRPRGVNLIGYLSGELGIGTSARLMDAALEAAGVPSSTFAVTAHLQSRTSGSYRHSEGIRYDMSLLAVNADQTETVSALLPDVISKSYRIGMWYWEVESFPVSRDGAFAHVDEVWVATDFIRRAIAQRAPVPVRTVTPPLPQRSADDPPDLPMRLGIPSDRPWFFFAFDYLSTAERKNPLGLIDAFVRAFPSSDPRGPLLVIKTLNAARRAGDATRVRGAAAHRSDVILIDEYLEPEELTALMARCTAYVSLHRAEGLGLTIAEAMAWGRPVVVSAYSGNMQFTDRGNAFLVPCSMTSIPDGAEPYPAGTPWADPDLDVAAAILRRIVDDPETAAAVGRQAAEDIRLLHSPIATAGRVREALDSARSRSRKVRRRARRLRVRRFLGGFARRARAAVRRR